MEAERLNGRHAQLSRTKIVIGDLVSDLLEPRFGEESMRYSLLLVTSIVLPWAAWHYIRAGRTIDADLERATKHD